MMKLYNFERAIQVMYPLMPAECSVVCSFNVLNETEIHFMWHPFTSMDPRPLITEKVTIPRADLEIHPHDVLTALSEILDPAVSRFIAKIEHYLGPDEDEDEEAEIEYPDLVIKKVVQCGGCGASVPRNALTCEYCRSHFA